MRLTLPYLFFLFDIFQMNMIKVSSIMGIDPNPFDAKTFVEEDTFERDGAKTRIRLVNNIVRHRFVKGRDGKTYVSVHFFKSSPFQNFPSNVMLLCMFHISSTSAPPIS